ncbi:DNA polymerase III [Candidatus Shapirobacteria bacterium CG10_big_fil_rev_8_21_14_0_10_40_9]|uniref:DNA polymerase III n=1 Tax=Candidatus Shapirobacteria bacterium CG10_big_fil_rev_8_21_14_0_10_40_9 TaxID=1974888 RepID=A0A2M8L460_9BACT|nr:MAG: DNA polymerase III [Candidatus Shapirobacteria bacterium CG10_big_fil_rev_8_21_14_0_10_40_9]
MAKDFTNKEVAKILRSVAAAYEVKGGDRFKIMAYDRASTSVEHATSEVKDLWDDGKLGELAGIGAGIASHLDELFRTGKVRHFEEVMRGLPPAMFELLSIPGIGAKTAYKLCQKLGIKDVKKAISLLEECAKKEKIRVIEGFGEESEKDILRGIEEFRRKTTRILLPYASQIAEDILSWLRKSPSVIRADPLGSLRRMVSTVGDVDIAAATNEPKKVIAHFVAYPKKKRVLEAGTATASLVLKSGYQVDLMVQPVSSYGALLQHFTGSKQHNIALREYVLKKGLSLSEYGIKKDKTLKEYASEENFYKALGMDWIPPEIREDSGEIEATLNHELPHLVELKDIKGDLHVHSDFPIETSHDEGTGSIEEIMERGLELGYEYIGFTEHNPSTSKHKSEQIIDILKRKKEKVEKINYSYEKRGKNMFIRGLNSLEIDIKPDGTLGIPEEGLKVLDYAIVSVHTSFRMGKVDMAKRVLTALEHPKVKILGHPTGRKLNQREGYELDWEKIFDFCLRKKKWLEVNAWPDRLDLPDILVREAVEKGVKMVVCTDSHALDQMDLMRYGVAVARRGWAEKSDIVNTLGYNEFLETLERG